MKKSLSLRKALERSQKNSQLSLFDFKKEVILNPVPTKEELEHLHLLYGTRASKSTKKYRRLR